MLFFHHSLLLTVLVFSVYSVLLSFESIWSSRPFYLTPYFSLLTFLRNHHASLAIPDPLPDGILQQIACHSSRQRFGNAPEAVMALSNLDNDDDSLMKRLSSALDAVRYCPNVST
jgi:hypothetical protein